MRNSRIYTTKHCHVPLTIKGAIVSLSDITRTEGKETVIEKMVKVMIQIQKYRGQTLYSQFPISTILEPAIM